LKKPFTKKGWLQGVVSEFKPQYYKKKKKKKKNQKTRMWEQPSCAPAHGDEDHMCSFTLLVPRQEPPAPFSI
jgi:hypothetical protein